METPSPLPPHEPNNLPDDPQARIQALLERMDREEASRAGVDRIEERLRWQKSPLRYLIGPFLLGVLFDAWQKAQAWIDEMLWSWAQQGNSSTSSAPSTPQDPRAVFRKALEQRANKDGSGGKP